MKKNKKIFKVNSKIKFNQRQDSDKGQKLWKRAKAIILGGNSLLSKNPNLFLPNKWPTYFSRSKGCKVWDLNNGKLYKTFEFSDDWVTKVSFINNTIICGTY